MTFALDDCKGEMSLDTYRLLSIQVGLPQTIGRERAVNLLDQPWYSGIFKKAVDGPINLGQTGLVGDGQADTRNHGGPEQAVLAYSADHYPLWREELEMAELPFGGFGENFTITGLAEDTVCIGDAYKVEDAVVQVSQPRQPCWKLERRLRREGLVERVLATGRTGWYFRVLQEGSVQPGLPIELLERPFPLWTITRAHEVMRRRQSAPEAAAELASCALLSPGWRGMLRSS